MGKWFRGFRLKMLTLIGVSTAIIALLSVYSVYQLRTAGEKIDFLNTVRIPLSANINILDDQSQAAARYLWVATGETEDQASKAAVEKAKAEMEEFETVAKETLELKLSPEIRAKLEVIVEKWPAFKNVALQVAAEAEKEHA